MRHYVYVYRLPGIRFCANSEIHAMIYPGRICMYMIQFIFGYWQEWRVSYHEQNQN